MVLPLNFHAHFSYFSEALFITRSPPFFAGSLIPSSFFSFVSSFFWLLFPAALALYSPQRFFGRFWKVIPSLFTQHL